MSGLFPFQAYDTRARELHGEKARLNFPRANERTSMGRSSYRGISVSEIESCE